MQLLSIEKPDFVAVTGDVISDYAWKREQKNWGAQMFDRFASVMEVTGY